MEQEILKKLKELRLSKGYSTDEIARKLNIEKTSYEKVENGTNKSWHKYFFELLTLYEYSPEQFFQEINGKNFIQHQVNNDHAIGQVGTIEKLDYANKPMVKSLLTEKDTVISMFKERDSEQKDTIHKQDHRIQDLLKIIEQMLGHPPRPKDLVVSK